MVKLLESRLLWGALLILAGVLFLLQNLGLFAAGDLFWALLFGLGGVFFLSVFFSNRQNWWALIPGFTLLGIGVLIGLGWLVPGIADRWGGFIVLGSIALGFLVIYLLNRSNWWAIIPAGVLLTLALIAVVDNLAGGIETGGLLFLGIGLTFGILALNPTPEGRMKWAWIPAGILLIMGLLLLAAAEAWIGYLWPVALILVGIFLIYRTFLYRR
jgi:hypothetical protein